MKADDSRHDSDGRFEFAMILMEPARAASPEGGI